MSKTSPQVEKPATPGALFISMGLDMSWRLAMGVLVPIIAGVELDKVLHTTPMLLILGFVIAIWGTVVIIRRSVRLANEHPVLNPPHKDGDV